MNACARAPRAFSSIAAVACLGLAALLAGPLPFAAAPASAEPMHGIAMHGEPALPPDYTHFPSANPDAPQGGTIGFGGQGTFDSLNPFIVKGSVPDGLYARSAFWNNNVWESLLVRSWDEPFTLYGHLAEFVEVPDDRSWVEFTMNPDARFSDGEPVTAEDVVFSFETLKEKGRPRGWHNKIDRVEINPGGKVRFIFGEGFDRELPLIVGLMHVLPKHATDPETFGETSLEQFIGSGPYVIDNVDAGRTLTLRKNPDYWGQDLPSKQGFDNFDEVRIEYFRDANTLFEAFKKGIFDINLEVDTTRWSTGYGFPAVQDGRVVLESVETGTPQGMNGLVFNLRNPMFQDIRVREALTHFLDFEWINQSLYENKYRRTGSYFQNSVLSALGRPAGDGERALLADFPDAVREDIMEGTYAPPVSDGSGQDRAQLRRGIDLLNEAGYERQGNVLVHTETGERLAFEILVRDAAEERLALAYQQSLNLVGVEMSVRQVDSAQYWERILNTREFDMIRWIYSASLSPGNEQLGRWSKIDAETFGRLNFAGVSSPAVDAMIDALLAAETQEDFVDAVRAYDRVLMSGFYVVPLFHSPEQWVAYWSRLSHPEATSLYGVQPMTWWSNE